MIVRVSLGEAIGVAQNMSIKDITERIENAAENEKKVLEQVGVALIMNSLSAIQAEFDAALMTYNKAVEAVNLIKIALGIGDVPTKPLTELSKKIKDLELILTDVILNTYIEVEI